VAEIASPPSRFWNRARSQVFLSRLRTRVSRRAREGDRRHPRSTQAATSAAPDGVSGAHRAWSGACRTVRCEHVPGALSVSHTGTVYAHTVNPSGTVTAPGSNIKRLRGPIKTYG